MIKKMTAGILSALGDLIKIVLLLVVLFALIAWAKASPETAQAALNKAAGAVMAVITWVADWITRELSQ